MTYEMIRDENGYYGSNYPDNKYLTDAELAKRIRAEIKKCGIKANVRKESYSMGRTIIVTVKLQNDDFIPFEQYLDTFTIHNVTWIALAEPVVTAYETTLEGIIRDSDYIKLNKEDREKVRRSFCLWCYKDILKDGVSINNANDRSNFLTNKGNETMQKVQRICDSFNYDYSEPMTDYYDVNFWSEIKGVRA